MYGETGPAQLTQAGWYPDPHLAGTMRYWDGRTWSEHTASGYDHPAPSAVHAPYQRTVTSRPKVTFGQANRQSLLAIGFGLGYLVLAQVAGIVMLGIIPFMAGTRAIGRKEPLAPLAMAVAIGSVILGIASIAGR